MKRLIIPCALGALFALWSLGCEDDESGNQRPPPPPGHEATAEAAVEEVAKEDDNETEKRWKRLKMYFLGSDAVGAVPPFSAGNIAGIRDPFEPTLIAFVPRPDPPEEQGGGAATPLPVNPDFGEPPIEPDPIVEREDLGPTQRFKATDYRVVMIRWGTSVNKALVEDPEGESFVIANNTLIGNNDGRVVDITRYDVTIKEDNREKPIVLSIQPPILRINEGEDLSERLFTNQAPP